MKLLDRFLENFLCNRPVTKLKCDCDRKFWHYKVINWSSVQFSSVAQSCLALCDPMDCSMPGLPVRHQLPEFTQTHVHWVSDAIQSAHPLSSPSPPAFNLSKHWGLLQGVSSLHQVAKVLEFQLQYQSFQWIFRIDFLQDWLAGSPCSPRDSQESVLQHHSSKASILRHSAFFTVQLSHPYMATGKTMSRWTFVGKVMSLLSNMLSRLVITFLPRGKCLLISWLQSPSAVILEPPKNKVWHRFPISFPWSDRTTCYDLPFLNVELQADFFTLLFHFHQDAF